ncbi:glycosyltransferase [Blastococcus sp. SYSU D00695]
MTPRPARLLVFCGATGWGGAEVVLGHLLAALPERFDVRLLGVDATVLTRLAHRRPGVVPTVLPRIRGGRDLPAIAAHRRAMRAVRADLVHVNLPVPFSDPYTVLAATTLWHTPVIGVAHLPMAPPRARTDRLVRRTAPRLQAVVGVSARAARQVEQLTGLPAGRVRVVPNGVPEPAPAAAPLPRHRDGFVVGAVGRLVGHKGFDVLLRAAARVPALHVVLVGEGPERPALERLAAELGIGGRVRMPGWSEPATGHLRSFDALAVPSRQEGLPLVLLEAMLAGTPVVASAVGGIPDAVADGHSALLVPPEAPDALADALRRLVADPGLRDRLVAGAGARARRDFTVSAMARRYEELYDDVLRPRGRTDR